MTRSTIPAALQDGAGPRVWRWGPQWYWYGWRTLIPFQIGHDEYARRTLVIGWTVTGRLLIAYRWCGDDACYSDALDTIEANHPDA